MAASCVAPEKRRTVVVQHMTTYELTEHKHVSFIHLYPTHAVASDGEKMITVNLTAEQIVQLAADVTEMAAKILRWEARNERASKDRPDADSRGVG